MHKLVGLIIIAIHLMGCAAALVPESRSPKTKIDQASTLFNEQGRPLAAVKLLNQAVELAQLQNDKASEATAEFYLAEIHKTPGPKGKDLDDPKTSLRHFGNSIRIYEDLKQYKRAAFAGWNSTVPLLKLKDRAGACGALRHAEASYERKDASADDTLFPPYTDGALLQAIRNELKKQGC